MSRLGTRIVHKHTASTWHDIHRRITQWEDTVDTIPTPGDDARTLAKLLRRESDRIVNLYGNRSPSCACQGAIRDLGTVHGRTVCEYREPPTSPDTCDIEDHQRRRR